MTVLTTATKNRRWNVRSENRGAKTDNLPATVPTGEKVSKPASEGQQQGVSAMVEDIADALAAAIDELHSVNSETKILALNARIEAMRAGTFGAAFGVVAGEMQKLSERTAQIADAMATRTQEKTKNLIQLIETSIRGTRLSDLALSNIDLVDRNLYERTCDVRWWATDVSLVDALTNKTTEAEAYASKRLGVILDAYTVYYDLVLCNLDGEVVANGRPNQFHSVGSNQKNATWFQQAIHHRDKDEYGFQTAHDSSLVDNQTSLIYSCGVRTGGEARGRVLGALGIIFNWGALAQPILDNISVDATAGERPLAVFIDQEGKVLASNQTGKVGQTLTLPNMEKVLKNPKGFFITNFGGAECCVGFAKAPGFETYSTEWISVIIQPINARQPK